MQTFLPYESLQKSARCLDIKRLNSQRVEALTLANTIAGRTMTWTKHPAYKMWEPYERYLCLYGIAICEEWISRGYKDTVMNKFNELDLWFRRNGNPQYDRPHWLGNEKLHASHRAALLFKNPEWYGQFKWTEEPDINYYWPT